MKDYLEMLGGVEGIIDLIKQIPEFKPVMKEVLDSLAVYEEEHNRAIDYLAEKRARYIAKFAVALQNAGVSDGLIPEMVVAELGRPLNLNLKG